jgi:hypothetical protein
MMFVVFNAYVKILTIVQACIITYFLVSIPFSMISEYRINDKNIFVYDMKD